MISTLLLLVPLVQSLFHKPLYLCRSQAVSVVNNNNNSSNLDVIDKVLLKVLF